MTETWKECLHAGRLFDPKTRTWHTITPQDVRDGVRNLAAMVERGRQLPLVWEHQDVEVGDPEEWKRRYARATFGRAVGARLSTTEDVRAGRAKYLNSMMVRAKLYDPADAAILKRVEFVSPKIYRGYTDSDGSEYRGTTAVHIAATPTPVQFTQAPFTFELSDATPAFIAFRKPAAARRKSRPCTPHNRPRRGTARTLSTTGASDMADENETPEGGDEGAGGAGSGLKKLIESLRKHGMNIPADVKDIDTLAIVVDALSGDAPAEEMPEEDENPDDDLDAPEAPADGAGTTAPAGGAPMLMSTTDANPVKRKRAQQEVKGDRDEAVQLLAQALKDGKTTGFEARPLQRVFRSCELSVTADGAVTGKRWDAALKKLAEITARAKGSASGAVSLSATAAGGDAPAHLLGGKPNSPEREADVQKLYAGQMSLDAFNAKHK